MIYYTNKQKDLYEKLVKETKKIPQEILSHTVGFYNIQRGVKFAEIYLEYNVTKQELENLLSPYKEDIKEIRSVWSCNIIVVGNSNKIRLTSQVNNIISDLKRNYKFEDHQLRIVLVMPTGTNTLNTIYESRSTCLHTYLFSGVEESTAIHLWYDDEDAKREDLDMLFSCVVRALECFEKVTTTIFIHNLGMIGGKLLIDDIQARLIDNLLFYRKEVVMDVVKIVS